jgi:hypothetical protein
MSDELIKFRNIFTRQFTISYWILFILVPICVVLMWIVVSTNLVSAEPVEKMALVASLQVGLGIFIGFVSLFFGFMMAWVGIEAAFTIQASAGAESKPSLSLQSASPGLLFALFGTILIGLSLYKNIGYEVTEPALVSTTHDDSRIAPGLPPIPPPQKTEPNN